MSGWELFNLVQWIEIFTTIFFFSFFFLYNIPDLFNFKENKKKLQYSSLLNDLTPKRGRIEEKPHSISNDAT